MIKERDDEQRCAQTGALSFRSEWLLLVQHYKLLLEALAGLQSLRAC
jgi:hypothetical protein